jgi:hypothetical protein
LESKLSYIQYHLLQLEQVADIGLGVKFVLHVDNLVSGAVVNFIDQGLKLLNFGLAEELVQGLHFFVAFC